jgi:phosphatidylinositol phospholipase C delta
VEDKTTSEASPPIPLAASAIQPSRPRARLRLSGSERWDIQTPPSIICPTMSQLISEFTKFNPFSKKNPIDDEDKGEAIDQGTVAGGGHASRQSAVTKNQLRVSHTLKNFLVKEGVLSEIEAGLDQEQPTSALREFLDKPHVQVPPEVIDRNHPLPDYFISSSHNTYLMAHQLFGESHASAYEIALHTGSRCVEIDAWDNDDDAEEPKVTHGYCLTIQVLTWPFI